MELKVVDKRVESQPPAQRQNVVEYAVQKGAPIEVIERMWELQVKAEAAEAKRAYITAMAAFKKNPPQIEKDKLVEYSAGGSTVKYKHASLYNIVDKISSALAEHGLSAAWKTEVGEKIVVTCTITHEGGHSESTSLPADPDKSGSKNSIQALGSAITYLQRYTLLALTGLATADMDDDGRTAADTFITEEQAAELTKLIKDAAYKDDGAAFLAWLKVETVDTLPAKEFGRAKAAIIDVIKKRGGAK